MDFWLSLIGCFLSLLGNFLIMFKKKSGWLAWILGNVAWIAYNFAGEFNAPMVVMYLVYAVINTIAFVKWLKAERTNNDSIGQDN